MQISDAELFFHQSTSLEV